jgi:hypothetical protein
MKRYLIAATLILGAPQSLLAADVFYVIRDNTAKECRIVTSNELTTTQPVKYKDLGKYATMDEAKAALAAMKGNQCPS